MTTCPDCGADHGPGKHLYEFEIDSENHTIKIWALDNTTRERILRGREEPLTVGPELYAKAIDSLETIIVGGVLMESMTEYRKAGSN